MDGFKIVTDSLADLPKEFIVKNDITIIPSKYCIDGVETIVTEDSDATYKEFYSLLREGAKPTTMPVDEETFIDILSPVLETGVDIIYIGVSSQLSETYNIALKAQVDLEKLFPHREIIMIDSRSASLGQGLMVTNAVEMKNDGRDIDEVEEELEKTKGFLQQWFIVDDLSNLFRGERLKPMASMAGLPMAIKPLLRVNEHGKMVRFAKIKGRKKAIEELLNCICLFSDDLAEKTIYISHGDCEEDLVFFIYSIKARFNPKNIVTNYIGPTVGSHAGCGAIAIFFEGMSTKLEECEHQ